MPKYLGFNLMFISRFAFLEALFFIVFALSLCERAFRSRLTLREEGQVELLGEAPNELSAVGTLATATESVNRGRCLNLLNKFT